MLYEDASDAGDADSIYVIGYVCICKCLLLLLMVETNGIFCADQLYHGKFLPLGEQVLAPTPVDVYYRPLFDVFPIVPRNFIFVSSVFCLKLCVVYRTKCVAKGRKCVTEL